MPLRHLLFNRRNGAPRRKVTSQPVPISLDSVRYFSLDTEFPAQTWPTDDLCQTSPSTHSADGQDMYHLNKQGPTSQITYPHDPNISSAHTIYGAFYRPSYSDYDSHSLHRSDLVDTDVSSVSHSSFSSTSHVDMMFEEDYSSADSLSRKSSLASNVESETGQQQWYCPLLTGQMGKCSPALCGPASPCLRYINEVDARTEKSIPVHQNIRELHITNTSALLPVEFPGLQPPMQQISHFDPPFSSNNEDNLSKTPPTHGPYTTANARPSLRTSTSMTDDNPKSRQNKKVRARQAHSLVERKYRENLNAKIYELHQLLLATEAGRATQSGLPHMPSAQSTQFNELMEQESEYADEKGILKVKKSDVLVEAIAYVHKSEADRLQMQEQIQQLRDRIQLMEEWIRRSSQR